MNVAMGYAALGGSPTCNSICLIFGLLSVLPSCGLDLNHDGDHETTIKLGDGSAYRVQWHGPTA